MRVFIFGAGYSAKAFAREISGRAAWIGGTTRATENFARLREAEIEPFIFDGTVISPEAMERLAEATHLVISIAPDEGGDPVLRAIRDGFREKMPALRWVSYLSTVGVYGDHHGRWVDEESECRPASRRSVERLEAEGEWRALGEKLGAPAAILRLSGIYGPGQNALFNLENGTAKRIIKPGQIFNRIHVEDIAGALAHLAERGTGGVFNVTDDEPAPPQDVVAYAAELMGVAPPPEIDFEEAEMSPMARSFYGEAKRVSNAKLKAAGYRLRFPDYRAALEVMWRTGDGGG